MRNAVNEISKLFSFKWPPILLLLYGRQGMSNRKFVMEVLCGSQKQAKMRDISAVFSTTRQGSLCGDEMRGYHREDGPSMPNCINNVLIERGVKLVPWNCTRKESRLLLANAFRGTRLEQWMKEMNPVSRKKSYLLFKLSRSNSTNYFDF